MTALRCGEFVEMATTFLDGALDTAQQRQFVDHVVDCAGCELYLDRVRRTVSALDLPQGQGQRPST